MGNNMLTYEELNTLLVQIEGCMNSRPLCPLSTDPMELAVLTPGHFLIGEALSSIPEPGLAHIPVNRLSRWQLSQKFLQQFWKRWNTEYLSGLQQRQKWLQQKENIEINDMVILKDENLPPLKWNMGRIIEIHPGKDGCVRVVTVKTAGGIFKRPIVKVCKLPIN